MTREEFLKTFPDLVKSYQPAPAVLERLNKLTLLIIIGPSGVGKTTLINRLKLHYVPSDTTRDPRPDEIQGQDFYFRTDYDGIFSELKTGQFVQVAVGATGDLYATRASSFPDTGTATMPVMADVVPMFRELGFKDTVSAFIVPPTYGEWMRRMGSHGLKPDQLQKRLAEGQRSFEFALNDKDSHFILNDDLDKAVNQTKLLMSGEPDMDREAKAHQAAQEIYEELTFA